MDHQNHNGAHKDVISDDLQSKIQTTLNVYKEMFTRYKPEEVFISFNGGKDCTVLLDLLQNEFGSLRSAGLKVIYLRLNDPFPEIEKFVKDCEQHYGINISIVEADMSMKEILRNICERDKTIRASLMGSRRTDPYCANLYNFQPTDRGWPELMRVNPLLDWTCANVWEYLLKNDVPYCSLYDIGYTSIGSMKNTSPNPNLEVKERPGTFLPAYELLDDSLERAGRHNK